MTITANNDSSFYRPKKKAFHKKRRRSPASPNNGSNFDAALALEESYPTYDLKLILFSDISDDSPVDCLFKLRKRRRIVMYCVMKMKKNYNKPDRISRM
jgi:hypothetical protein